MSTKCKYSVKDLETGEWRPANRKEDRSKPSRRCSNKSEDWYEPSSTRAKGAQIGKRKGKAIGKARHVALETLGEDGMTKVHQEATIIGSSIIDSNKQMFEAGSANMLFASATS